jgi:hypothetical protein
MKEAVAVKKWAQPDRCSDDSRSDEHDETAPPRSEADDARHQILEERCSDGDSEESEEHEEHEDNENAVSRAD